MEQEVATVGLDLAMNVFQIHAIATDGAVLIKRNVRRTVDGGVKCPRSDI